MSPALDKTVNIEALHGKELIAALLEAYPKQVAVSSSFGAEAAVLLSLVAEVDPRIPVLTVDTGCLFEETRAYRELLIRHLGLTDVRILTPDASQIAFRDPGNELWESDPDACCHLRKLEPMNWATKAFKVLIDGRKRFHGDSRAKMKTVEQWGSILKAAPLAGFDEAEIERAFIQRNLPRHPLSARGYRSIGCEPCTSPVGLGEPVRSGRWAGKAKTECGLHKSPWF
ncbi:MAG: phosphoadenylyl-sulfate reductase [Alphaproteobacteria bacterium]|nr:phosphoadenylyl-sulfate reductase [Alphaproteobacteria bacterium]